MPISSLILHVTPGAEAEVAERLANIPSLEVHTVVDGQIVVVTDTLRIEEDRAVTERVRDVPGVITANVVFCSMEDCMDGAEEFNAALE